MKEYKTPMDWRMKLTGGPRTPVAVIQMSLERRTSNSLLG